MLAPAWALLLNNQKSCDVTTQSMSPYIIFLALLLCTIRAVLSVGPAPDPVSPNLRSKRVLGDVSTVDVNSVQKEEHHRERFAARLLHNSNLMHKIIFEADMKYEERVFSALGFELHIFEEHRAWTSQLVARNLDKGEYYLQAMKAKNKIPPGSTILDLGTNVAVTAVLVAKLFPDVKVIGVEAIPYNYVAALKNVEVNGVADRVTILCAALSSDPTKTLTMSYNTGNTGSSTSSDEFYKRGSDLRFEKRTVNVKTITVDEIIDHFGITSAPFIKLDCEGCEYDVIPNLSARALDIFRHALVFGETHCDRMTVDPAIIKFTHDVYTAYDQEGPRQACGRLVKKWDPESGKSFMSNP